VTSPPAAKVRVATASLAGCFGCHMSFLDIDERLVALVERIELDASPLTDRKHARDCDLGLIEGGVCNAHNVHVLRELRARCRVLVAVGACAINGGLPALRNALPLGEVLSAVYLTGQLQGTRMVPHDPELPLLLDHVHPIHDVVHVDWFLPGCPPSADAIWQLLTDLLDGRTPTLGHGHLRYD
jgi:NAD-reducing hydrogenase small subunit